MATWRTSDTLLAVGGAAGLLYLAGKLFRLRRRKGEDATAPALQPIDPYAADPSREQSKPPTPSAPAGITRRFDALFEAHGRGLPVAYLRALAKRESDMNPAEQEGPAWGLLQVIEVVRTDYNKRHGTRHQRRDLLDPAVNVQIAADTLRRIVDSYRRYHPQIANLQEDWGNRRFVELLTFGWNGGYSEKAGVGKVVSFLEAAGKRDITIDTVHEWARGTFGASPHLLRADKVAWSKSVAALYLAERARDDAEAARPAVA